ncbi:hypothetical protein O6P43_019332 [Quillaja saponaria]|uniref:Uncharacterized protein n=1 Tax=Quillaja saponaria TaxID=32244 RepID=A0AAD7PK66_QUISA|nr:hypothetical protein O6P43_019332 [Quillaja saponaria]
MMQNPWEIVMMKSLDFAVKGAQWMAGACHNFYNNVKVKEEAVGKKMWLSQKLHHTLGLLSEYETKQCNL